METMWEKTWVIILMLVVSFFTIVGWMTSIGFVIEKIYPTSNTNTVPTNISEWNDKIMLAMFQEAVAKEKAVDCALFEKATICADKRITACHDIVYRFENHTGRPTEHKLYSYNLAKGYIERTDEDGENKYCVYSKIIEDVINVNFQLK